MGFALSGFGFAAFASILVFHGFCYSSEQAPNFKFLREATSAPPVSYYDYIIIGGGTAGCPLAATLSENARVLLLERGGSPYGIPNITDLTAFGRALSDRSPLSPAQQFISEDGVINARARVLGGGSTINAGFYSRAESEFIDAMGWDGDTVRKSYEWVEKMVAFEPDVKKWQSAVRDGLVEIGIGPYNGFTYDHLMGTKIGGTIFDNDGHRHTAADLLKYANPKRLNVFLHASVHRILFKHKGITRPKAHGVVFRDARGRKHKAYLKANSKNEVILSAGALGSPQLLMLSGIGPWSHLQALNLSLILNNPLVGHGMSDNPMNAIFVPSPLPVEVSLIQVVGITSFGSYIESSCGENFPDNSDDSVPFKGGFILEKIKGPISRGHLLLKSNNPNENPLVKFNYFNEPEDLQRCVDGLKVIESVIESKAFSEYRYGFLSLPNLLNLTAKAKLNLLPKHANLSTSLEQFCKDTVMTIWHYHGGCEVGKVVDSEFRVLGVDALRVVDGSAFSDSPGTNPQATIMMFGRYMGLKILQQRLKNDGSKV